MTNSKQIIDNMLEFADPDSPKINSAIYGIGRGTRLVQLLRAFKEACPEMYEKTMGEILANR